MRPWLSIIGGSVAKELWMLRTPIPFFFSAQTGPVVGLPFIMRETKTAAMTTRQDGVKQFFCGRERIGCRLRTDDGVALVNRAVDHA